MARDADIELQPQTFRVQFGVAAGRTTRTRAKAVLTRIGERASW
jgi:hypothetical protein